jgi:tRNA A-37 threonylcarbamoyl transferase component Bud32
MHDYIPKRFGAMQVLIREDYASGWSDQQWADFFSRVFAVDGGPDVLKAGAYKTVLRAELHGAACIVKRYHNRGLLRRIKSLVRPSRARQEFRVALAISRAGIPTAAPLCLAELRRAGLVAAGLVVLELIANAQELQEVFFATGGCPGSERREIAAGFGRLTGRIFQQGIFQSDYSLNNFLLQADRTGRRLFFVDFEKVRMRPVLDQPTKIWLLAKLNRVGRQVSRTDRLRFLRAYAEQDPVMPAGLKELARTLQAETLKILASDLKRQRLTSIYTNRRYERISLTGWAGLCRKGYSPEEILSQVAAMPQTSDGALLRLLYQGSERSLIALQFPDRGAVRLWALINTLKVAGAALELPEVLAQGRSRGFLVLDPAAFPAGSAPLSSALSSFFPDAPGSIKTLLCRAGAVVAQEGSACQIQRKL